MTQQTPTSQWRGSPRGDALEFKVQGGVFVSAFHPARHTGLAIQLPERDLNAKDFEARIREAERALGAKASECELKVIGAPEHVAKAQALLKGLGLATKSSLSRAGPAIEVYFYPKTGRVRAATEAGSKAESKIKVLIVDDSATIRKLLHHVLSQSPRIEVVAMAEKPSEVEALILKHRPNVLTLDIHMPEMDGVSLLKKLHRKYPIPTIMISSISMDEGPLVLEALEHGAVDYIQKPSSESLATVAPLIVEKVITAAQAKLRKSRGPNPAPLRASSQKINDLGRLIAIGSSTGGTEALRAVLTQLPTEIPPILIVQHIPPVFSAAFAQRMNALCPFEVKEAEDQDEVKPGRVLIAPGAMQMQLIEKQGRLLVQLDDGPPVNRHKPSVDYLFHSVAKIAGQQSIGVILTGMGADGARGLLAMRKAGARTIGQDEDSCVVYGMPKVAAGVGAVEEVLPLERIPGLLVRWLSTEVRRPHKNAS
jgi:two-component system chemotaxis response regulator CheB